MESHADIEIGTKDADAQEHSKNAAVSPLFIFFFQSLVAAALLPVVLRSSGGDAIIVVWRLSLLLCAYFYSAVCVLSSATRNAKARLFMPFTYAASMAFVGAAVLSHAVGTAIIYLDSVWVAAAFGHALADHNTTSTSSDKIAPSSEEAGEKLSSQLRLIAFLVIVFAALALSPACITYGPDVAPQVVVAVLPMLLCFFLTMAIICALEPWPSQGAPNIVIAILGVECDTDYVLLCSFILPFIIFFVALPIVGEVGATVLLWICVIGLAVLLGYCLSLHASSACNTIDGWLSVRNKPKPELLNNKQAAAAGLLPEERADAAGGNKDKQLSQYLTKCQRSNKP